MLNLESHTYSKCLTSQKNKCTQYTRKRYAVSPRGYDAKAQELCIILHATRTQIDDAPTLIASHCKATFRRLVPLKICLDRLYKISINTSVQRGRKQVRIYRQAIYRRRLLRLVQTPQLSPLVLPSLPLLLLLLLLLPCNCWQVGVTQSYMDSTNTTRT